MPKILSVVGARPQFIKHAPVQLELRKFFDERTIHTGQHYDDSMSRVFFEELGISKPDFQLSLGAYGTQGAQTGAMLTAIEAVLLSESPDVLLVYGDTNSTLAGVLAAVKLHIPVVHIEAGLRSHNLRMPEEVNRIVADRFSSLLFCPTDLAVNNLLAEGLSRDGIIRTGDVMADALRLVRPSISNPGEEQEYYFATLHRPSNTDDGERLSTLFESLNGLDRRVICPLHPRTKSRVGSHGLSLSNYSNIQFIDPVGYIDCISYQSSAAAVITDSGGIQKEAYLLKKPCVTLRAETEWVETLEDGWNQLIPDDLSLLADALRSVPGNHRPDLYGDGYSAAVIVSHILSWFGRR